MRLLFFVVAITLSTCTQLPSTFQKCNKSQQDFEQCLIGAVENALQQLDKPIPELSLPSFEPLQVPPFTIPKGEKATRFETHYRSLNITGLRQTKFSKFEINFDTKTLDVRAVFPNVSYDFDYEIDGLLFTSPIHGAGRGYARGESVKYNLTAEVEEYDRDGEKFIRIVEPHAIITPNNPEINLGSLFGGDQVRSRIINKLLNERIHDVLADMVPLFKKFHEQLFVSNFNNVLDKVPVQEIFGN